MKYSTNIKPHTFDGKSVLPALSFLIFVFLPFLSSDAATIGKPVSNLGLVGYWSFDEGTSTLAHDISGNLNTATLTNMDPTTDWVSGKRGKALDFDGSNDYVQAAASITLSGNSFSIATWFKTSDTGDRKIFSFGNTSHPLQILSGALRTCVSGTCTMGSTRIDDGIWHYAVVVGDATSIRVYLDGRTTPEITAVASGSNMTGIPRIGAVGAEGGAWAASHFYLGQIDDVRVYSRTLSTGEIIGLYRSGQSSLSAASKTGLATHLSFNEGSGIVAHDQSGNQKNGAVSGATWTDGKLGKALSFDGVNDYVVVSGMTSIPVNGPATISGWFYPTTSAIARGSSIFLFEDLYQHPLNNMLYLQNGADYFPAHNAFTLNTWHHIVLTYNGQHNTAILYLDGVRFNVTIQTPGQNHTNLNPVYFGSDGGGGGGTFPGKIDDIRIYNRVLTQDEALALYKAKETVINQSQNNRLTDGLVGYWTFNGPDVTTTIADVSGQGNHGYFIGGATSTAKTVGKVGQALSFNGSNTFMRVSSPYYQFGNEITVSSWVKFNSFSYVLSQGIYGNDDMNSNVWLWHAYASGIIWYVNDNGTWRNVTLSGLTTGKWYHIVTTADSSNTKIYLDGNLAVTGPGISTQIKNVSTSEIGTNDIRFGSSRAPHNGILDEVRVYNRALPAAEVKQLYNMGR